MVAGLAGEVRPVTRLGGEREAADLGVVGFAEIIPQALPGFQRVDRPGAVAGLIRIGQPDQPVLVVGGAAWVRPRSLLEQHGLVAGARQGPGCRQADDEIGSTSGRERECQSGLSSAAAYT